MHDDPDELGIDEYDNSPEAIADYWRPIVADAQAGDLDATTRVFSELVVYLRGRQFDNAVHCSPEAREFLIARIDAGMRVPKAEVGEVMGLGKGSKGKRKSKYHDVRLQYLEWYWTRLQELGLDHNGVLPPEDIAAWKTKNLPLELQDIRDANFREWVTENRHIFEARAAFARDG